MAIYRIEAPDGSTIRLEGPDGATDDELLAAAEELWTPEPKKSESLLDKIKSKYDEFKNRDTYDYTDPPAPTEAVSIDSEIANLRRQNQIDTRVEDEVKRLRRINQNNPISDSELRAVARQRVTDTEAATPDAAGGRVDRYQEAYPAMSAEEAQVNAGLDQNLQTRFNEKFKGPAEFNPAEDGKTISTSYDPSVDRVQAKRQEDADAEAERLNLLDNEVGNWAERLASESPRAAQAIGGVVGMTGGIWGAVSAALPEGSVPQEISDVSAQFVKRLQTDQQRKDFSTTDDKLDWMITQAISNAPSAALSILGMLNPATAPIVLGTLATSSGGGQFRNLRRQGVDRDLATAAGIGYGVLEAMFERLEIGIGGELIKRVAAVPFKEAASIGKYVMQGVAKGATKAAIVAGGEGFEEVATEAGQIGVDYLTGQMQRGRTGQSRVTDELTNLDPSKVGNKLLNAGMGGVAGGMGVASMQPAIGGYEGYQHGSDLANGMQFNPQAINAYARQSLNPDNAQLQQIRQQPAPVAPTITVDTVLNSRTHDELVANTQAYVDQAPIESAVVVGNDAPEAALAAMIADGDNITTLEDIEPMGDINGDIGQLTQMAAQSSQGGSIESAGGMGDAGLLSGINPTATGSDATSGIPPGSRPPLSAGVLDTQQTNDLTAPQGAVSTSTLPEIVRNWDRTNRTSRADEWMAGAAESNPAFNAVRNSDIPAHGMAKAATLGEAFNNLVSMLNGGIRSGLYVDWLAEHGNTHGATGTAAGHAYRDGPFIIAFRQGAEANPTSADVTGVLVNPSNANLIPVLQQMFPNIVIRDYHNVADVVAASQHTNQQETNNANQATQTIPQQTEQSQASGARTYLDVPFQSKNVAKKYGAKWDEEKKLWYADTNPVNVSLTQYIPQSDAVMRNKATIVAAALNKTAETGEEHQAVKHPIIEGGWMVGKVGADSTAVTEDLPKTAGVSSVKKGDRFTDAKGQTWEVWNARTSLIEAHPVVDGKVQVNRDSGQRFATDDRAKFANPEARTDFNPLKGNSNGLQEKAQAAEEVTPRSMERKPGKLHFMGVPADELREAIKDLKLPFEVASGKGGASVVKAVDRSGNQSKLNTKDVNALRNRILGKTVTPAKQRGLTGNLRNDLSVMAPGLYENIKNGGDGEANGAKWGDVSAIAESLRDENGYMLPHGASGMELANALTEMIRDDIANGGTVNEVRALEEKAKAEKSKENSEIKRLAADNGIKTAFRSIDSIKEELLPILQDEERIAKQSAASIGNDGIKRGLITKDEGIQIAADIARMYSDDRGLDVNIRKYREIADVLQDRINQKEIENEQRAGEGSVPDEVQGVTSRGDEGGTGPETGAGFQLSGQSEEDIRAEEARVSAAQAAEDEAAKSDETKAKKEREAAEVQSRMGIASESFDLTPQVNDKKAQKKADNAEVDRQLAGQDDIFNTPPTGGVSTSEPRKSGTPLTKDEETANSVSAGAAELAMQIENEARDEAIDPDEVIKTLTYWAEDADYTPEMLRAELIKELGKRGSFRGKTGLIKALDTPVTAEPKRWEYSTPMTGESAEQTTAMNRVVDYMNGDINREKLIDAMVESELPQGTIRSITNRLGEDSFSNAEIKTIETRQSETKPVQNLDIEAIAKGKTVTLNAKIGGIGAASQVNNFDAVEAVKMLRQDIEALDALRLCIGG